MSAGEGTTVIGKSVRIVGDLSGSEDLQLEGELQGSIQLSANRLTLGASALVRGNLVAQDVVVLGRMEGDIRAKGRVELRSTAVVQGNIYAGTLSMEEGATFRGQIDPSRAGEALPQQAAGSTSAPAPARTTPLPAALAAVAASRAVPAQPTGEQGSARPSTPLFTESEA